MQPDPTALAPPEMSWRAVALHLRLPFSLMLAPLYLLGAWLAAPGQHPIPAVGLGFATVHLLLYSGTNAFNSYYDRDDGPIGGLFAPPKVSDRLLHVSLVLKAVGLFLSLVLPVGFIGLYLVYTALSVAYSHPAIRAKANPWTSLAIVTVGQGAMGFGFGFSAAGRPLIDALAGAPLLGLLGATVLTAAMYPTTQIYQLAADAARGDRTLARVLGARRAFAFAGIGLTLAAGLFGATFAHAASGWEGVVIALGVLSVAAGLLVWSRSFDPAAEKRNFLRTMSLNAANSILFTALILLHLAGVL